MSYLSITYGNDLIERIAYLIDSRPVRLASGSPRRRDILTKLGVEFEQFTTNSEDQFEPHTAGTDPVGRSVEMTRHKAEAGSIGIDSGLVIAADTIVVLDGEILSKPSDRIEAASHLIRLAGRDHHVYTTIVLRDIDNDKIVVGTADSRVTFKDVTREEIDEYVATGESDDKAGAYGIQGMGKFLVDKFRGNLDNIIGFPALLFVELLEELTEKQGNR